MRKFSLVKLQAQCCGVCILTGKSDGPDSAGCHRERYEIVIQLIALAFKYCVLRGEAA